MKVLSRPRMESASVGGSQDRQSEWTGSRAGSVTQRFGWLSLVLLVLVVTPLSLVLSEGRLSAIWPALLAFLGIAAIAIQNVADHYPHGRVGLCNIITFTRGAMVASLATPLAAPGALSDPALAWTALAIALVALALDGVDGFFARRSGLVSAYGARFDMEIDCAFALLLAIFAVQSGKVEAWGLLLGLMRYLFVAAGMVLPWLNKPVRPRFSGKVVCVIQIAALIALLSPLVDRPLSVWIAAVALALVVWSFAVDIVWYYRNR